jgi:LysM repeat protein
MLKKILYFSPVILTILLYSCSAKKPVATSSVTTSKLAEDYINAYKDIAVSEMKRTGIPASITLAQGMIESDYGRSTLARTANNHFGIKCHNGWTGPTVTHHDDKRNECFRKYKSVKESFDDHSDFLKNGSRYKSLFENKSDDYKAWAKGLKKAGYATNPDYANMLIRSIEDHNLYYFDRGNKAVEKSSLKEVPVAVTDSSVAELVQPVAEPRPSGGGAVYAIAPRIMKNNGIDYIIVKDSDTRDKLEKEFGLLKWELPRYNDLDSDFSPVAGQILYLHPKKDKAESGKEFHAVGEGETMYLISQKYGIKLKSLYEMNQIEKGREPETGRKLSLRGSAKGN